MSEPGDMVERVARALFDDHWQDDPSLEVVDWKHPDGHCICETERNAWRRSATAALAASGADRMREALEAVQAKMAEFIHLANNIGINDADGFYLAHAMEVEAQCRQALGEPQ